MEICRKKDHNHSWQHVKILHMWFTNADV